MISAPRVLVCGVGLTLAALVVAGFSCSPPCESVSVSPTSVCRRADAGAITPDASFVVQGQTGLRSACSVSVDGGLISLSFTGGTCSAGSSGVADPVPPALLPCEVPALEAGTYRFNSGTTFTVPESADAGVPLCP